MASGQLVLLTSANHPQQFIKNLQCLHRLFQSVIFLSFCVFTCFLFICVFFLSHNLILYMAVFASIYFIADFLCQCDQTKLSQSHASVFDCDWQPVIATHCLLFVSIKHLNVLITTHVLAMLVSSAPRSNLGSEDCDMTRLGDVSSLSGYQ